MLRGIARLSRPLKFVSQTPGIPQPFRASTQAFRQLSSSNRRDAYVRFSTPDQPQRPNNPREPRKWYSGLNVVLLLGGCWTVYYVSHLEQVPDTGRWRFMILSTNTEATIGDMIRSGLLAELKPATLPANHPLSRHVRRVVSRILHASNLGRIKGEGQSIPTLSPFGLAQDGEHSWNPDASFGAPASAGNVYGPQKEWEVVVVNDRKMVNAMAAPGLVVVFTGILPICQDEEGLAAVLAHEIGHVVARHTAERISSQLVYMSLTFLLQALGLDMGLSDIFSKYAFDLPNSRKQETEADLIGLRLMSRACYDPAASPAMFERLGRIESKIAQHLKYDFFRTHPTSESRIKYLEEHLQEGYSILAANPNCTNVRRQLESFRETARELRVDDDGVHFL
ncbi:unnamed protein product [Cyclocybe aegerita]|uniref:Peptidase M48 domain-containing protein n=1 Tax=Cyclocybe aegerita TaxID=1973307 RepID=A0A8S0WKG5_CYCAE|nr:unnamed protein product [Cyclocybe aegerita]